MSKQKLFDKLRNNQKNVRFYDFTSLVKAFGFKFDRSRGSHHMYKHLGVQKIINIQDGGGKAKPYQIRQFLTLVRDFNLQMREKDA